MGADEPPHGSKKRRRIDAALFDMDGVVTDTAGAHSVAWKKTFDDFLRARANGGPFTPFDAHADYRSYVDGKSRIDGVLSFLDARRLDLPMGREDDSSEADTSWGLANRKNEYFHHWLESNAVKKFPGACSLIKLLRAAGVKTAVFSASRNAGEVLRSAAALTLFDAKVDGCDLSDKGLPGKPDPAMLLEAAARLHVEPRRAAVVEDSIAGIEAGVRGGFATVIGVDRTGDGEALTRAGADLVVSNLGQLDFTSDGLFVKTPSTLRRASDCEAEIQARLSGKKPVVFLDYDGTLTPIVKDYRKAHLPPETRCVVAELGERCTVAVVSGRDVDVVRQFVGLDSLYYAGSHGFEISGPRGWQSGLEKGSEYLPEIDAAERELTRRLADLPGHAVERKRFSVEVHYRQVPLQQVPHIERAVDEVIAKMPRLRKGTGKKVFRVLPDIPWDKGQAVLWLLHALDLDHQHILPIYIGDDETDEDAFRVLAGVGLTIVVRGENGDRPTAADCALESPSDVKRFIEKLSAFLDERARQ